MLGGVVEGVEGGDGGRGEGAVGREGLVGVVGMVVMMEVVVVGDIAEAEVLESAKAQTGVRNTGAKHIHAGVLCHSILFSVFSLVFSLGWIVTALCPLYEGLCVLVIFP